MTTSAKQTTANRGSHKLAHASKMLPIPTSKLEKSPNEPICSIPTRSGLGAPDICPGVKAPIFQERNPDERPGHMIGKLRNHHRSYYPNLKIRDTNPFAQEEHQKKAKVPKTNPFASGFEGRSD